MSNDLLNIFLTAMQQHFYDKYEKPRDDLRSKYPDYEIVFAHELTRCSKANEFDKELPDMAKARRFEPALILGELVHVGVDHITLKYSSRVSTIYNLPELCVPETYYYKEFHRRKLIVCGTPDLVFNGCPVDLKYQRAPVSDAKDHHISRVKIYMNLMRANTGYVFYITPRKISTFVITEPYSDEELLNLVDQYIAPRWDWECSWCIYSKLCEVGGDEGSS